MLSLLKATSKQNPLDAFLSNAESEMRIALHLRAINSADELEAFVRNQEELNFGLDLCQRVLRLSAAFDLLCTLTDRTIAARQAEDKRRNPTGCYAMTEEDEQAHTRIHAESELLTHYLYYELKSITDMLRLWNLKVVPGSELEYVLKARDRLLAHPEIFRIAPNPFGGSSYPSSGGFMSVGIGTPFPKDPFCQTYYRLKLGIDQASDRAAEQKRNELLLRSKAKNKKLTDEEVTRIKLFGVREPDLLAALNEFATLLATSLTEIKRIVNKAVEENGYERYIAAGPLQSHRVL
jgi:hypothetical protein